MLAHQGEERWGGGGVNEKCANSRIDSIGTRTAGWRSEEETMVRGRRGKKKKGKRKKSH